MKILFICEGIWMRSPTAEAYYNLLTNTHDATSAGAAVGKPNSGVAPRMKMVLDEDAVDTTELHSKQLTREMFEAADRVVYFPTDFMPDYVKESPKAEFWDVIDPHYHHEGGIDLVRQVRDDIKQRVKKLVEEIQHEA